jgi:hypothetical protein
MKTLRPLLALFAWAGLPLCSLAQTVNIVLPPANGMIAHNDIYIAATASGPYEIQSVQASLEDRSVSLIYGSAAYTNCPLGMCVAMPGWSNSISLAGLTRGSKVLTVTAIDVLGNSNSTQRTVVYDLRPTLMVNSPAVGTVARPEVSIALAATDDDPAGARLDVFRDGVGGMLLASDTNALNTTLNFSGADGATITLMFRAMDTAGQTREAYRTIHVQSSSNLVEIESVSGGRIADVQGDRVLFETFTTDIVPPDYWLRQKLHLKTRSDGAQSLLFSKTNLHLISSALAPAGAVLVASGSPFGGYVTGYALYQIRDGSELLHNTHGLTQIALKTAGKYAAWGWGHGLGFTPTIYRTDLQLTNTGAVLDDIGNGALDYDLAANGDIVFARGNGYGSHSIYRYRGGTNLLLATISGSHEQSTNQLIAPRTDGSNVFYIQITPTNQMLKKLDAQGESTIATGNNIGANYRVQAGWVAYLRNATGTDQVWRCSPDGVSAQLTFFGSNSSLAGLAPNGEVALYNGTKLYVSKGSWPAIEIASANSGSGLTVISQDGRWLATLGRSLFQIYTGTPQLVLPHVAGGHFGLGLVGAKGQQLVLEATTNLVDWTAISTNYITDGASCEVQDPVTPEVPGKMYRLRLQ